MFKAVALDPALFTPLLAARDDELALRGARRRIAIEQPGYPCRISLRDAAPGERVILLHFEHHAVDTPYRAAGPIYVREQSEPWQAAAGAVPPFVHGRLLSLRGYSARGMLVDAKVAPGDEIEAQLETLFADPRVGYVHAHFAQPGCYACRFERAK